ncbi:MAG: M15 family metallopeptidase [Bacteroidetes bacterium]|nr:M15 family metallopeptidase [Bacteroidota bacterium]
MRSLFLIVLGTVLPFMHAVYGQEIDPLLLTGRIQYSQNRSFARLPQNMSTKEDAYLQSQVIDSLKKMFSAAQKDGITFKVISASRNFETQKNIWERKWNNEHQKNPKIGDVNCAQKILRYSSMPGTSRHHWGTDFDLNSLEPAYFGTGKGKKEYDWLREHAASYGFYQPYDGNPNRTGYQEEKWHWSFFPLSQSYLNAYIALVKPSDINGFKGAQTAEKINVITQYVEGVAPAPQSKD